MSEARINRISNEKGNGGPSISGITTFSGLNYFVPPRGTTAERPSDCPPGSIRFNTDSAHLEYFDGLQWLEFEATNVEVGISTNIAGTSGGLGHRGLFGGGIVTAPSITTSAIKYITISTLGNSLDFGDLLTARRLNGSCSSSTRGVWGGGYNSYVNTIDYVTISSTGDAQDFGDLNSASGPFGLAAASSSTRGLFFAGYNGNNVNTIDYITIASTGDAKDFGDVISGGKFYVACCSSSTRALIAGGYAVPAYIQQNTIDYVTIASTGNSLDFGDLTSAAIAFCGFSNSTRGIFAGYDNAISYVTISSLGNATDFGDLLQSLSYSSGCSSSTRGVVGGGQTPTILNVIQYISIMTTGNAQDFGDLSVPTSQLSACSNGHGGL
jgi:hypothetical protein